MLGESKNHADYRYLILCSKRHENGKTQKMFGIAVIYTCDNQKFILDYVSDLALNLNKLYNLIRLCNKLSLDPVHLHDVIHDFISDF